MSENNKPFEPQPDQEIALFDETYVFQGVQIGQISMVDAIDIGTRGTIYRVHDPQGRNKALKVFRPGFQESDLEHVCRRLEPFRALEGFLAAERRMILPDDSVARDHPELRYAMLMPWIAGRTWCSLLNAAGEGNYLREWAAIHLCARFLQVMRGLESLGAAHTDIAAGNVVVDLDSLDVQLIDLEDLFLPGQRRGIYDNEGSPGYRHPRDSNPACREGDRYATAILAAEMLLLARPAIAIRAGEGGLFGSDHTAAESKKRFAQAREQLCHFAPEFLEILRRAWDSTSLAACPSISELSQPVAEQAMHRPRGAPPALARNPIRGMAPLLPKAPPAARATATPSSSRIHFDKAPLATALAGSAPPAAGPAAAAKASRRLPGPPPVPRSSRSRIWKTLAWLAVASLALLVAIWIASNT